MKFKNTFNVGMYTCEMTFSNGKTKMKWSPWLPPAGSFSKQQMAQYRAGRDNLLANVAEAIGGSVMVVEASAEDATASELSAMLGVPTFIIGCGDAAAAA